MRTALFSEREKPVSGCDNDISVFITESKGRRRTEAPVALGSGSSMPTFAWTEAREDYPSRIRNTFGG